ncbi:MAG: DUF3833 domain-containing protein [Alphaproteobacteria bacterium]|nr:DUF3833 domain-containing protein [Alphaproteobacteria bacterium]
MRHSRLLAFLTAPLLLLGGCAGVTPDVYATEKPVLDLYEYFDGRVDAWGYFADRSGKVVRRFTVTIEGSKRDDALELDEHFTYADSTTSRRVWTIHRTGAHTYTGTAGDVIGLAQGRAYGNALQWNYRLAFEVDGRTYHVNFDDWMYLQDATVMLNHSVMSKFGVRLGEVVLAFRKA